MNKEEDKRRLVIIFVIICGATLKSSLSIAAYTSMEISEKEEASSLLDHRHWHPPPKHSRPFLKKLILRPSHHPLEANIVPNQTKLTQAVLDPHQR